MGAWDTASHSNDATMDIVQRKSGYDKYLTRKSFDKNKDRIYVGPGVVLYALKHKKSVKSHQINEAIKNLEIESKIIDAKQSGWKKPLVRKRTIKKEMAYLKKSLKKSKKSKKSKKNN